MTPREKAELELRESLPAIESESEAASFFDHLIVLVKWKSRVLKIVGAMTISAILISMSLRNQYTATTKILPPQQSQSIGASAALSQLGPLAALASGGLGLKNPSDIYVAMLKSRAVEDVLINRFDLMKRYKSKFRIDAEKHLSGHTEIKLEKEGIITLSVEDPDPEVAAEIANAYVIQLHMLTKTLAVTEAQKRRLFFEGEVKSANEDLAKAELGLKQTQQETGMILADSQSRAMIQALSSIRAQIAAKEVELQAMKSFATAENPDLTRTQDELAALQEQESKLALGHGKVGIADVPIEQVPTAALQYMRALREVKYHEALFELLAKQYELAKVDEAKDAVMVQQLDKATPPERKSSPHRSWIVIAVFILAFLVGASVAFISEAMEKAKEDPNFQTRLHVFRFYLHGRSMR